MRDRRTFTWTPEPGGRQGKRKRQDEDEQEVWPSGQRLKPIALSTEDRKHPRPAPTAEANRASRYCNSPEASEVAFLDLTADDEVLPELTHETSSLSPDGEEVHLPDGFSQYEYTPTTGLLPGPDLGPEKVQTLTDDALFSEFLRSPSPAVVPSGVDGGNDDFQISAPPQTINPADVCLASGSVHRLTDVAADDVLDLRHKTPQGKGKPRVTLHVRPNKSVSKPRVSLRLIPPKEASQRKAKPQPVRTGSRSRRKQA